MAVAAAPATERVAVSASAKPSRPSAQDIYERVKEDARDELERPVPSLGFSGLFAGFTLGATGLAVAVTLVTLDPGPTADFVAKLLYPIGFIAVILGRAQFFTENTLYPVLLSLHDRSAIPATLRLWMVVFAANIAGALLFSILAVEAGALDTAAISELARLGSEAASSSFWGTFWSAVVAGWLLALVAWLVEATENASAQFAVIWLLTFVVGLGAFDHCVATAVETLSATLEGELSLNDLLGWLGAATLGNVAGGVLIVSLLNYGQVEFAHRS